MRIVPTAPDEWHPHVTVAGPEYEGLLYWLRGFVAVPLTGDALVLRGVLPPRGADGGPRVALWNGRDLSSSVAFDIAVTDAEGDLLDPLLHILALRRLAADHALGRLARPAKTDTFGIPVHDVRQRYAEIAAACGPTISDALDLPLRALTAQVRDLEDCALWGFVLADDETGRYYVRIPGENQPEEITVGVDVRLRDRAGTPKRLVGMLDVYLPGLAYERDLTRYRVADGDGYCDMVCDVTELIGGPEE
ncbi:hypothetical protein AB0L85_07940 [Streptomyces sp. NPDC052051]|uniref:hypothetical protein n=1 Tax=Streptomyces sp. NPDC052051 TaxID=3154649 RepID=UPI00341A7191